MLANGSLSAPGVEGEIRKRLVEKDLVDCIVAMPSQLFYSTQIPVCLWFLARSKAQDIGEKGRSQRNRTGSVLFVDARSLGQMVSRTQKSLSEEDIARITGTYHNWRGDGETYEDVPGFCASVAISEIASSEYNLSCGRYVGVAKTAQDGPPLQEQLISLNVTFQQQVESGRQLDDQISNALASLVTKHVQA